MILSFSNNGIQWTLNFGADSVTNAVNDLEQNITISSQEIHLAIAIVAKPGNCFCPKIADCPKTISLAIALVSNTRHFEQSSSASSN